MFFKTNLKNKELIKKHYFHQVAKNELFLSGLVYHFVHYIYENIPFKYDLIPFIKKTDLTFIFFTSH